MLSRGLLSWLEFARVDRNDAGHFLFLVRCFIALAHPFLTLHCDSTKLLSARQMEQRDAPVGQKIAECLLFHCCSMISSQSVRRNAKTLICEIYLCPALSKHGHATRMLWGAQAGTRQQVKEMGALTQYGIMASLLLHDFPSYYCTGI
jgi:hypothetical protein